MSPDSGILFGAFDPSDWQLSNNGLAAYAAIDDASGQPMSMTHPQLAWAQGVTDDGAPRYQRLYTPRLDADRAAGRISLLTWMSFNLGHPEQNELFNLPSILNGQHDEYIGTFGQDAAAYGHPFIVRLDPEMNGWWEGPFCEANEDGTSQNGNSPGQFAQAWRYIVDLARAQGASNVAWYWCANVVAADATTPSPTNRDQLASFYPGDDVVDFVGTDLYNPADTLGHPWFSFGECLEGDGDFRGDTWATINGIAPSKPWLIGEVACHDAPGDKPAWIVDMFQQIPTQYPRIAGLCWFNWDAQARYLLTQPTEAVAAWGQGTSAADYLKAGMFPLSTEIRQLPGLREGT